MEGVLEEMRKGLDRLQAIREVEKVREQQRSDGPKKRLGRFAETMQLLKRPSASYRRCYWKSASEMLFPIFYGHMTFAPHRCWTVFIKKGVFLEAEAWRREFGRAVRHAALRDGGGEILQYNRSGMDPYPLVGWKKIALEGSDLVVCEGPDGQVFESLQDVYEHMVAIKTASTGVDKSKVSLSVLQHLLSQ